MKANAFYIVSILLFSCIVSCNSNAPSSNSPSDTPTPNEVIKKGEKLEIFYPFDSVKEMWINNWKGNHRLSENSKDTLIKVFKNATFYSTGASIKPGHLNFTFIFENGKSDVVYGSNDILIFEGGEFYRRNGTIAEFHIDPEFNFENY